mmetsp:Transcript_25552/g.61580  ORF Transcript_25552/g.61580 Transcript_25552/m.61580 type:complete len:207 (+) Transcript_25552:297-917(+)
MSRNNTVSEPSRGDPLHLAHTEQTKAQSRDLSAPLRATRALQKPHRTSAPLCHPVAFLPRASMLPSLVHFAQGFLEASGVALLGHGKGVEPVSDLFEALIPGRLGHAGVHLRVLVGLADDGAVEVLNSVTDGLVGARVSDLLEELEMTVGMPRLTLCGGTEHRSYVVVALNVGSLRKEQVPAVRHALSRKRILEILKRCGALELRS